MAVAFAAGIHGLFLLRKKALAALTDIVTTFRLIAQGDLGSRIDISGRDEVGRVLSELAAMQVQLRVVGSEIGEAEKGVSRQGRSLSSEIERLVTLSGEQKRRCDAGERRHGRSERVGQRSC